MIISTCVQPHGKGHIHIRIAWARATKNPRVTGGRLLQVTRSRDLWGFSLRSLQIRLMSVTWICSTGSLKVLCVINTKRNSCTLTALEVHVHVLECWALMFQQVLWGLSILWVAIKTLVIVPAPPVVQTLLGDIILLFEVHQRTSVELLPPLKPLKFPCHCKDMETSDLTVCKLGHESIMNKVLWQPVDYLAEGILTPNESIK